MEMLNYKTETYQTKEAWLNARGIGGSSASAIMGCNKWMSKVDLYRAIVLGIKKETKENDSMRYGVKLEPVIRDIFRIDFEKQYQVIDPNGFEMYRRTDKEYLTATIDGTLIDKKSDEKLVLEIKTHDVMSFSDYQEWNGHLPQYYFIQVCHYLNVLTDYKGAILCAKLRFFNNGEIERQEIRYYKIMREDVKESLINLENAITQFWNYNIVKKIIPSVKIEF